jgi:NADPH-dependent curcumin reductase CurA
MNIFRRPLSTTIMSTQPKNLALIYKMHPTGVPVPGEHLTVEDVGFDSSAPAPRDAVVLEHLYASFDPYMRGRMRSPEIKTYFPPFDLNKPMLSHGIARVIKSNADAYHEGDVVAGPMPIVQYSTRVIEPNTQFHKLDTVNGAPDLRDNIGALGMPGLTAYASLYEIGKPKKGETIFISSAAGAVGQIVGQIAKHEGLKVIGSVGSDDKLNRILHDLSFDGGFNYKKEKPSEALKRLAAPNGIDIYYENVGGEQLEAALANMNNFGRVVASGMISQYNLPPKQQYGVRGLTSIVGKRLTVRGFIVSDPDMGPKWSAEHQKNLTQWLRDGKFKALTSETVGIENGPEGFVGMLKGENFGKAVLKIKV